MKVSAGTAILMAALYLGSAGCTQENMPPNEANDPAYFEISETEHVEITGRQESSEDSEDAEADDNEGSGDENGEGGGTGWDDSGTGGDDNFDFFNPPKDGGGSDSSSGSGSEDDGPHFPEPEFPEENDGPKDGTGDNFGNQTGNGGWGGGGFGGGGWGGGGFGSRIGAYDLVSVGMMVYNIVESNEPKVLSDSHRLSILPLNPEEWEKLEGWTGPHVRTFVLKSKNNMGMTVLHFQYKIIYYANGNLDGRGAYIANLQVVPEIVNVNWGFKFDSRFEVGDIMNAGSAKDPIVGAHFQLQWRLHSQMKRLQGVDSYYLKGNSDLLIIE